MNRGGGTLELVCSERAGRSRIGVMRYDGLMRCSRPFPAERGGMRIVVATLGPGMLAGDRFTTSGRVERDAALAVDSQMATPVFAGTGVSEASVRWTVEDGATLCLLAEPLMTQPGSVHRSDVSVAIDGSGVAIAGETVALAATSSLELRTTAAVDGARAVWDVLRWTDVPAEQAFGTVFVIASDEQLRKRSAAAAWSELGERRAAGVRGGVGGTAFATVIRIEGARVWDVHQAVRTIVERCRALPSS